MDSQQKFDKNAETKRRQTAPIGQGGRVKKKKLVNIVNQNNNWIGNLTSKEDMRLFSSRAEA